MPKININEHIVITRAYLGKYIIGICCALLRDYYLWLPVVAVR